MNNASKIIIAFVAVAVIAGGALLLTQSNKSDRPTTTSQESNQGSHTSANKPAATTITYDGNAFNPSTTSVKSGEAVKIVNQSQKEIEFASDPHPTHTNNPEINTGDITPGASKTFTAATKGTWGFHNHYDPSKRGTITVE